jgi:vancomycin resistance protein YoaR
MWQRKSWLIAGITSAMIAAGMGLTYLLTPDVPFGVKVLDTPIGGMSAAKARTALAAHIKLDHPVTVHADNKIVTIQPRDIGMTVDLDATVRRAERANPLMWHNKIAPVPHVDAERLVKAIGKVEIAKAAVFPTITFEGVVPKPVYPVAGRGLDPALTARKVGDAWVRHTDAVVPIVDIVPQSSAKDVDRALENLARPAVSGPVTILTERGALSLTGEQIAASLVIDSDVHGRLRTTVDEGALRAQLKSELDRVEVPFHNATVADGQIVASEPGRTVDTQQLAKDLLPVLTRAERREVVASFTAKEPSLTSADLADLGIREQVSSFTTKFSGGLGSPRSINIITGAKKVDGAIVKPGETFSLNGFTGPRGYAEGYKDAPVILNGKLTPGVGGGLSQFTTTLFNAAYYAGMEDVEHHPHSIYFSAYPSVIESTIFYPTLDMKFRNNTAFGVLIDTSYTDDSLTVSFWSTKVYDSITTEWGPKHDSVAPKEVSQSAGPECIPTPGIDGFAQEAWRIFHQAGKEDRREHFAWRYDAEPRVTCGP